MRAACAVVLLLLAAVAVVVAQGGVDAGQGVPAGPTDVTQNAPSGALEPGSPLGQPAPTDNNQSFESAIGPQGPPCEAGPTGPSGSAGANGQNGQNGRNGRDGRSGRDADPRVVAKMVLAELSSQRGETPAKWAKPYLDALKAEKLVVGYLDGTIRPHEKPGFERVVTVVGRVQQQLRAEIDAAESRAKSYTDGKVGIEREQRVAADAKRKGKVNDMLGALLGMLGTLFVLLIVWLLWRQQQNHTTATPTAAPTCPDGMDMAAEAEQMREAYAAPRPGMSLVSGSHIDYVRDPVTGRIVRIARQRYEPCVVADDGMSAAGGGNAVALAIAAPPEAGKEAGKPPFPPSEEKEEVKKSPPPDKKPEPGKVKVNVREEPDIYRDLPLYRRAAPFVRVQGNPGQIALRLPNERRDQAISVSYQLVGSNLEPTVVEKKTENREAVVPVESGQYEVRVCWKGEDLWSPPRIVRVPNGTKVDPARTPLSEALVEDLHEVVEKETPAPASTETPPPKEKKPAEAKAEGEPTEGGEKK